MPPPPVSKIGPTAEAAKLWRLYGFTEPRDLVLEDLALALGVLVVEGRLDSADAWLLRRGKSGIVRVKEDIPEPGRKRFAIAHELGHWRLHEKVSQLLACTSEDMVARYKGSEPEIEANYFAAELLMPESLFVRKSGGGRLSLPLVCDLADYFLASLTATALRFVELSSEYCAVVVSENGRVRWWRGSERFVDLLWIEPGQTLSPETVAGEVFAGRVAPAAPEEVDVEAWCERRGRFEDETLLEEVIVLPRYGQVLSLLSAS